MDLKKLTASVFVSAALVINVAGNVSFAQPAKEFQPEVGQAGKDVVWVPTPQALVDKMLEMAKVTPKDYVIDLGSGDGRTVITAAKKGSKALGIEYNPDMVEISKERRQGRRERQSHLHQSRFIRERLFPGAGHHHVPAAEHQFEAAAENPRSETRHSYRVELFRHGRLETGQTERVEGCTNWCTAHLWIVPAKVQGTWKTAAGRDSAQTNFSNDHRHASRTAMSARRSTAS